MRERFMIFGEDTPPRVGGEESPLLSFNNLLL